MFIGHYAPAFAAAALPRAPRLAPLFVAAQLVDIAFFSFLPLGIEHMRLAPAIAVMNPMDLYDMPLTHSLIGALAWSVAFAAVLRLTLGNWTAGLIGGAVVLSHWVLDLIVHVPDLTIAGDPPKLGFGLWNYPAIAMPLEVSLLLAGVALYVRKFGAGWRLYVLLAILFALQAVNWFGAQPVAVDASVWALGLFAYAVASAVAWWADSSRRPIA